MRKKTSIIVLLLLLILSCALWFFSFPKVENNRMEATLFKGNHVIVNKLKPGLSLPFTHYKLFKTTNISNQDIISFYYPRMFDVPTVKKNKMLSRCVGVPGDTIQIINKELFLDSNPVLEANKLQYKYRLVSNALELSGLFFEEYGISQYQQVHDDGIYDVIISAEKADDILDDEKVSNIRLLKSKRDRNSPLIFPANPYYGFTKDDFGPVVIPYIGWTVNINYRNIGLYSKMIEQFEGKSITVKDNVVYIDAVEVNSYTFIQNYYFVMDDNRDSADDSRTWGFLPEDHIIGVVMEF